MSVEELDSDDEEFEPYRTRSQPFILTGAIDDWKLLDLFADDR